MELARAHPLAHINESMNESSFHPPQTIRTMTAKINMLAVTNSRTGCALGGKSKPSSDSDKTIEHFVRRYADLYVTGFHSLLINGALAPAEMLINGTTITRYEAREYDELEYFHIKLESHDVIYAEGAPAETLLNVDESTVNFADYLRRYGTHATEEVRCAPFVYIAGGRHELKSRLRSALSPWIDFRNHADVFRDQFEERGLRRFPTIRDRPLVP